MAPLHRNEGVMRNKVFGALAIAGLACAPAALAAAQTAGTNRQSPTVYVAHLAPMNSKVTGLATTGEASFTIVGDTLTISVKAEGLPLGIMHLQHFHGFKDNRDASCPTQAADANGDGVIDLIETEPTSGTTMVPFHDDPVSMEIVRDTYPKASADGTFEYEKAVSLKDLKAAFAKAFGGQELDLGRRVVFIHGVLPITKLPTSVASLGTIPAQVTLPIACGKIERQP
jgi:glucose/arabinose dehydrogenase